MIRFHENVRDLLEPVDAVRPHPDNDNDGDVDALKESILVNGVYRPIYASTESRYVLAGHTLYASLLDLGARHLPISWLHDLTPEQELRIVVVDNASARRAKKDQRQHLRLLDYLASTDKGLYGTAVTAREHENLAELLSRLDEEPLEFDPDPEPTQEGTVTCPRCDYEWKVGAK